MSSETTRRLTFPRGAWAGGLLAVALVIGGCGGGSGKSESTSSAATTDAKPSGTASASKAATVPIADFKFVPKAITVAVGSEVTWTNKDSAPHTATASDQKSFDTGTLKQGQSKTIVLTKAGTYSYLCQFHPFMTAKVVVR